MNRNFQMNFRDLLETDTIMFDENDKSGTKNVVKDILNIWKSRR